jgi:hypothetical protein
MWFNEHRDLDEIAREQDVSGLNDFVQLEMPDADPVPLDDFQAFVKLRGAKVAVA